jgi:two-component SAPR family response regulator
MRIFAIDDEQATLDELHDAIAQAEPYAEIMDFRRAADALDAIEERHAPDVVFSDIQMPGVYGLSFAVEVKKEVPGVKVIFVTGYEQYAVEAFRRRVNGYLMKPVDAAMVREELDALGLPMQAADPEKLLVRCFGWFDVFWHNEPLIFARTQTKELFAYLVDREGAACTAGEIVAVLWEDLDAVKDPKAYLRALTQDLRATLSSIGMEDALIRSRGQWAVRTDKLDCDYYRLKNGDPAAINAYNGEYMKQYSWAEMTLAALTFGKL